MSLSSPFTIQLPCLFPNKLCPKAALFPQRGLTQILKPILKKKADLSSLFWLLKTFFRKRNKPLDVAGGNSLKTKRLYEDERGKWVMRIESKCDGAFFS